MNKEVSGIVYDYLIANGYSGLRHPDGDCDCEIDDLFPCGRECDKIKCQAAYKVVVPDDVEDDADFYICTDKDAKPWEDDED